MDLSEPKLISPLLDDYVMGPAFSEHHGVCCCPAMTKVSNKRYIVKIISIPASQVQLDALLLAGAYSSKNAALSYYKELAESIGQEAEILKKLSRFEGFVSYDDLQIVEMEDGNVGYQVYLLSPYKQSLERYMQKNPMTQLKAVNLGLDLCASMVMCRRAGYLYVDLKPSNIFINEKNEYCVGDLGFVRLDSLKYASMPDKYRSAYTAPELEDILAPMNETVDIYSIGMILYQIYNDGKLPENEELLPPAYADYEMAEIIMKAISADPSQRWQDPMEMGQALVAYMQRNSVNDVPIVPLPEPPATEFPVTEEPADTDEAAAAPEDAAADPAPESADEIPADPELPAVPASAEDPAAIEPVEPPSEPEAPPAEPPAEPEAPPTEPPVEAEDPTDLTFMDHLVQDDTTPAEDTAGEIAYAELSSETSNILAQADELLAMEIPEPVVAPEPIEIVMPAPVTPEDPEPESPEPVPAEAPPAEADPVDEVPGEEVPAEPVEANIPPAPPAAPDPAPADPPAPEAPQDPPVEVPLAPETKKKNNIIGIIALIVAILLMLGAVAYGYHYYNTEYLQTVNGMEISGYENMMFVELDTDIDESLLTVTATDSYGNSMASAVSDHIAAFKGLNPDTIYKVTVTIDGFHELRGETTGTFTTPAQTKIIQFEATAGAEAGSVILTFTVDGPDSNSWTITYSAPGVAEKSVTFSGHVITIDGMTPGKEYTFRLTKPLELYMSGINTTTFNTASPIYAQDLAITQCTTEGITAVWTAPKEAEGTVWSVRCYSDGGFEQFVETTDLTVTFTEIDPSQAFTIEVTAKGMSSGVMTHISARSASILTSEADISEPLKLKVTWTFEGDTPTNGWLVTYEVAGSGVQKTTLVTEPSVSIYPAMPGDEYQFTVTSADGITVFNNKFSYTAGPVQVFSGYGVTADDMSFSMCRTPSYSNWSWYDLYSSSYTDTFESGEKASFVVKLNSSYEISDDYVDILFVVRNSKMEIVCTSSTASSWTYMWDNRYCELDIPTMPTEPGNYSIDIFFNGMAAARDYFTIE